MPIFNTDGASIYYETWGAEGDWVTLLNGHARTLTDFKLMGRFLVASGFRVLTFDHRGAGSTKEDREFSCQDMVTDVIGLWDHLGIGTSALLGISMGGIIAQLVLGQASRRITKLALVSTFLPDFKLPERPTSWGHDVPSMIEHLEPNFSHEFVRKNPILIAAMAKQILKQGGQGQFESRARMQKQAIAEAQSLSRDYASYRIPVKIFHGTNDRIVGIEEGRRLRSAFPVADILEFSEAGHLLIAEEGKRFYEAVANFLRADSDT